MGIWEFVTSKLKDLPKSALLIGLLIIIGAVAAYLLTTPACESRTFAFGIASDRTHLPQCAKTGNDNIAPAPPSPKGQTVSPAQASTPLPQTPDTPALVQVNPPSNDGPEIVYGAEAQQNIRKAHNLTLVDQDEDILASTPSGTFGFVYAGSFATVWKTNIGELTVRNTSRDIYFELQKRTESDVYIIGYMRGDAAENLRVRAPGPQQIKIYNKRYRTTDAIIAVPVADIESVGQSELKIGIPVLELGLRPSR